MYKDTQTSMYFIVYSPNSGVVLSLSSRKHFLFRVIVGLDTFVAAFVELDILLIYFTYYSMPS